ncbi:MAG: hypothetical protein LC650_04315 [Actinobacteria bacterium]|nr:hypothetical protein [Actinomycetota bacterium]
MNDLVLSLGHNSSAILVQNGSIIAGYEEERITGIKSDSSYPIMAISELQRKFNISKFDRAYISHWFANTKLTANKYCDIDHLNYAALMFAHQSSFPMKGHSVVIDGFGSFGECLSIYEFNETSSTLIHRAHGYDKSIGLFYQYATAFLGMKMHADEYKLLGYEAHIDETFDDEQIAALEDSADKLAEMYLKRIMNPMAISKDDDPIVNKNALAHIKTEVTDHLSKVCELLEIDEVNSEEARVAIAYYTQRFTEMTVLSYLTTFRVKNVVLSGGVFMNVKLNREINRFVDGHVCVYPLAGDQGAGLGVYQHFNNNLKWRGSLFWGQRDLDYDRLEKNGLTVVDATEAPAVICDAITQDGFVNVIEGSMEFGARALGHTTTYGEPERDVTEAINEVNHRTTIMPMAPIMTADMAREYLQEDELKKIIASYNYMIIAVGVKPGKAQEIGGAAHYYPRKQMSTARPQIVTDRTSLAYRILKRMGIPLINTSFNYHGVPIVYDTIDIIKSHNLQKLNNPDIKTIVVKETK